MKRLDDYGRRRWPDQQYGGTEEGYGYVPGGDRDWRRRDLSAGRFGNGRERAPYDAQDFSDSRGWNGPRRDDSAWQGNPRRGGQRPRGAPVYYPGRTTYDDDARDESSPHSHGYVSAYSSGYEDGYQAGTRTSREPMPGRNDVRSRWPGTGASDAASGARRHDPAYDSRWGAEDDSRYGRTGYEDYGVEAGRNFRQRPHMSRYAATASSAAYGRERPAGPKNYTRSDERVREEVCERLAHAPGIDVSDVTVAVAAGVVTLTGSVDNRRIKYEIEDIVDDTYGVSDVVNQIHVRPYGVLASE